MYVVNTKYASGFWYGDRASPLEDTTTWRQYILKMYAARGQVHDEMPCLPWIRHIDLPCARIVSFIGDIDKVLSGDVAEILEGCHRKEKDLFDIWAKIEDNAPWIGVVRQMYCIAQKTTTNVLNVEALSMCLICTSVVVSRQIVYEFGVCFPWSPELF